MQTLDFTHALTEIVAELKMTELFGLLRNWLVEPLQNVPNQQQHAIVQKQKESFSSLLFDSFAGYDRLSRMEATARILDGMELKELYEPARLTRIINLTTSAPTYEQLRSAGGGNIIELLDFFETIKAFIKLEKTCRTLLQEEKVGKVGPADSVLELQLTDYDEGGVEPERMSAVFSTLAKLQMNMARLLGVAGHRLTVKYRFGKRF
jgi:hypothetical protein